MKIYLRHRNGRCIEYMDLEGKWKSTGTHSKYEAQTIAASLICRKNEDSFGNFSEHILSFYNAFDSHPAETQPKLQ